MATAVEVSVDPVGDAAANVQILYLVSDNLLGCGSTVLRLVAYPHGLVRAAIGLDAPRPGRPYSSGVRRPAPDTRCRLGAVHAGASDRPTIGDADVLTRAGHRGVELANGDDADSEVDTDSCADGLNSPAESYCLAGRPDQATRYHHDALAVAARIGNVSGQDRDRAGLAATSGS